MLTKDNNLVDDIENIRKISIVPSMLEVICRSTGMGFAAIARVTQERWIACSVRDEIMFGLEPGGELQIETTICNEIRDSRLPVVIDHVANSEFRNHHTPKIYGFQSYISVPVFLQNGDFFGTLCAIDPKPALLNNTKTIGMFTLFAQLISFHLQSIQLIERSEVAVKNLNRQLSDSVDENRQYRHISNHNLQEPLRKIRIFSNMLVDAAELKSTDKIRSIASRINSSAQRFSMMIQDLSDFSELNNNMRLENIDLNQIIADVTSQLKPELEARSAIVHVENLPVIHGIPVRMEQVFFHLIHNAIKFSKKDVALDIRISSAEKTWEQISYEIPQNNEMKFIQINIEDNGIGIENTQLEKIFDMFSQLPHQQTLYGRGFGLAYCRKIIRDHGGTISAQSEPGKGTIFSIVLPV